MDRLRKDVGSSELFENAKGRALDYMRTAAARRVYPPAEAIRGLEAFNEKLQEGPVDPRAVLDMLHSAGSPATVSQNGGR